MGCAKIVVFKRAVVLWDTATMAALAICLPVCAIAIAFFYRPKQKEGLAFAGAPQILDRKQAGIRLLRGFSTSYSLKETLMLVYDSLRF